VRGELPLPRKQAREFPTWLSDNGDLQNLTAVRKQKIEIIPIRATFPALEISRITSKRGFDPVSILCASAFSSAPNSDRFKTPLTRNAQTPSGSYFISIGMVALYPPGLTQNARDTPLIKG
jgi:hypothetical protein